MGNVRVKAGDIGSDNLRKREKGATEGLRARKASEAVCKDKGVVSVEILNREDNVRRIEEFRDAGPKGLGNPRVGKGLTDKPRQINLKGLAQPMNALVERFEDRGGGDGKPANGGGGLVEFRKTRVVREGIMLRRNGQTKPVHYLSQALPDLSRVLHEVRKVHTMVRGLHVQILE